MTNEDIVQEIIEFIETQTQSLSDEEYMEVYYEVASTLNMSADAKAEELEK